MQEFVTGLAECNQVVRRIGAAFPALQVMDMQFNGVLPFVVGAAVLAGVVIPFQDILTDIVLIVLFAALVVGSHGKRPALQHRFETLGIEFCSLDPDLRDGQEAADVSNSAVSTRISVMGKRLQIRLIAVICSWILTSTDGACQPLCLLRVLLLKRGAR